VPWAFYPPIKRTTTIINRLHRSRKAQEEGTKQIKNAVFVKTPDFARPAELSPCPTHGHQGYGNAEIYFLIGDACGERMKSLLK
jgi:hypothetical protein